MTPAVKVSADNAVARMAEIKNQEIADILEHERKKKSPFVKWPAPGCGANGKLCRRCE